MRRVRVTRRRVRVGDRKNREERSKRAMERLQVFTGTAHPALAQAIAEQLGTPLGEATVSQYKNGETRVVIEESVRGSDVYIVQPAAHPVNHHLMELLIMTDAIKRASASRITAVIPYYGYAKQEK